MDSGCTSTSVPVGLRGLLTNERPVNPPEKIWIASGTYLHIVGVGQMALRVAGYELQPSDDVQPKDWPEKPCEAILPSSRTLVVDGLAKNTILVVSLLCSCVSDPRQIHYDAALVVIGYLVSTKNLGITFGGHLRTPLGLVSAPFGFVQSLGLHCYHDSSWGRVPRPMGGYVIMHNVGCVDWASKSVPPLQR